MGGFAPGGTVLESTNEERDKELQVPLKLEKGGFLKWMIIGYFLTSNLLSVLLYDWRNRSRSL